jgi:uncharacterized cupredoxin-like copper-binding protein
VVIAVVTAATLALTLGGGSPAGKSAGSGGPGSGASGPTSAASGPSVPVVKVTLTDSGGPMGEGGGPMHPGAMGLKADHPTVPHGPVTFRVTNAGAVAHEMVILPLPDSQTVGTRPFDGEAKIDETGILGEASASGGEGAGDGIEPGAEGRMTLTLAPGQYELVCNLMGHYVSGMYSKLTVT